jgi:hypothetical protein
MLCHGLMAAPDDDRLEAIGSCREPLIPPLHFGRAQLSGQFGDDGLRHGVDRQYHLDGWFAAAD